MEIHQLLSYLNLIDREFYILEISLIKFDSPFVPWWQAISHREKRGPLPSPACLSKEVTQVCPSLPSIFP